MSIIFGEGDGLFVRVPVCRDAVFVVVYVVYLNAGFTCLRCNYAVVCRSHSKKPTVDRL